MPKLLLLSLAVSLVFTAGAQSTTPTVTNAGGGSYNDPGSYVRYFEWSIGELTLIHTAATADSAVVVYQGVLQPCTDKPGFTAIAGDFLPGDFRIMPNPNTGKFEINFFIRESGQMDLELVDMLGRVYQRRSFRYYGCCRIEHFDISNLPAGMYMISATLTPDPFDNPNMRQTKRHSGLKVIKVQ
jgi:Secretion system C-terminal sorting domain